MEKYVYKNKYYEWLLLDIVFLLLILSILDSEVRKRHHVQFLLLFNKSKEIKRVTIEWQNIRAWTASFADMYIHYWIWQKKKPEQHMRKKSRTYAIKLSTHHSMEHLHQLRFLSRCCVKLKSLDLFLIPKSK